MESRSYMFGIAKKRSTLMESKGIEFPREEENAPRMRIVKKECPAEYASYRDCLEKNSSNPDVCKSFKQKLFECGRPGFKKANTDFNYVY